MTTAWRIGMAGNASQLQALLAGSALSVLGMAVDADRAGGSGDRPASRLAAHHAEPARPTTRAIGHVPAGGR
jgi:hypothetical protein